MHGDPKRPKAKRKRARKPRGGVPIVTSTVTPPEKPDDAPHMVGYARVSMSDQNNQRQIDEMVRFGVAAVDIFTDTASGKDMDRPGWRACWKDLREGDLLVIHSIDRLGRDLLEVVRTVRDLHDKGAELKVLSMDIDTRTPTGRLMLALLAAMAQWERELILERTMHGLQKARERGVIGGSKATFSHEEILAAAKERGVNQAGPALGMSKSGFKKALTRAREWQQEQEALKDAR